MAFVVDSQEWCFDGWREVEVIHAVEGLLDRVSKARERQEIVWIGHDLQTRAVLQNMDLWSLCSPSSPIKLTPEIWQELTAWLAVSAYYAEEEDQPNGADVVALQIDKELLAINPDVAWAHHRVRTGLPTGCLGLRRRGQHITTTVHGSAVVHWVTDESGHRNFWRDAIDVLGGSKGVMEAIAPHAYPDLYFHTSAWGGLNDLSSYLALRKAICNYLAVFDNSAKWVFTFPPPALVEGEVAGTDLSAAPTHQIIERRFHHLGLVMAPEKPNVHAKKECREAREIVIGSKRLYCEWHAKLQPHIDRIHIHSPVPESDQKVVVAIFHKHLPLP